MQENKILRQVNGSYLTFSLRGFHMFASSLQRFYRFSQLFTKPLWSLLEKYSTISLASSNANIELFNASSSLILWPFKLISIQLLPTISPLSQTLRSWEYRKWSPTKEPFFFFFLTNSPCQHPRKCMGNSMKNNHIDVRL